MQASGLSAIPYHDHVPSFGDWGWWIAVDNLYLNETQLKDKILALDRFDIKTRYLTTQKTKQT